MAKNIAKKSIFLGVGRGGTEGGEGRGRDGVSGKGGVEGRGIFLFLFLLLVLIYSLSFLYIFTPSSSFSFSSPFQRAIIHSEVEKRKLSYRDNRCRYSHNFFIVSHHQKNRNFFPVSQDCFGDGGEGRRLEERERVILRHGMKNSGFFIFHFLNLFYFIC